jgi:ADP-heptose:LPS heptosyltransferase
MKTHTKFLIDRAIAMPLAWTANLATRAAAPIARRDHSINPDEVHTIAVAKLLGMGSIIQATPLLYDLRRSFPRAKLVFVTTRANRELIDRLEVVDDAVYIDDKAPIELATSTAVAIRELLRRKIDLYIDLEVYSAGASVLSVLSGARNRCGFYRSSARFKKGLFTHLTVFNPRVPISAIYRQLHVAVGGRKKGEPAFGPIVVRPDDVNSLAATLAKHGLDIGPRYVVVNANASDLLLERRWPTERYVELIEELARRHETVVLVGAPSEASYVDALVSALSPKARTHVRDTSGKLRLGELFALLKGAACVVTNDTGPMHFAIALDRPTVCLYGPVSPEHYGVHKTNVEMLYHAVYCSPCAHEIDEPPCAGNNVCMQLIGVGEVLEAIERQLTGQPSKQRRPALPIVYDDARGNGLGVIVRASVTDKLPTRAPSDAPPKTDDGDITASRVLR